ncbi:right-handed parallel beta-helix repeat-containing protein [Leisingera daeponensis]|uniref:right-handed parallel beta-helix repeat-containing protein n=1 Tax=Leisingera daeponensis TaxID=405746 RepID=UPI001376D536|nr:right-handed parallel beta-helix repeat-containing protein [Leisingera daeponensis]
MSSIAGLLSVSGGFAADLWAKEHRAPPWYSSGFGWSAGQDISGAFADLLSNNTFKAGDTLVLEDTYRISGSRLRLPENFTLTAKDGAGLDVRTASAADSSPLFILSNGATVDNVTFDVVNAPETSYDGILPAAGQDYHKKRLLLVAGDGVTVKDSTFSGNVSMHIDVQGSNGLTVDSSLFEGGFYQLRIVAGDGATISGSHFRKSLGDGIKTESTASGDGPSNMTVTGSFFESNARDGLDTAGGFRNGKVLDCVFYNNGVSGFDLKSSFHDSTDFNPEKWNTNITVDGSQFINNPNGIVVSAVDRTGLLNASNAQAMPHGIRISNTIFESTAPQGGRAFLIKDGYDITWEGISLLGKVSELRFMQVSGLSLSGTNVGGDIKTTGAPRVHSGTKALMPSAFNWRNFSD